MRSLFFTTLILLSLACLAADATGAVSIILYNNGKYLYAEVAADTYGNVYADRIVIEWNYGTGWYVIKDFTKGGGSNYKETIELNQHCDALKHVDARITSWNSGQKVQDFASWGD